jgi:hypothetical protein
MTDPCGRPIDRCNPVHILDRCYHVCSAPEPHHDPADLVHASARTIHIVEEDGHAGDPRAEPSQREMQSPVNMLDEIRSRATTSSLQRPHHGNAPISRARATSPPARHGSHLVHRHP